MDPQRKPDLTLDCLVHDLNNVFQTIVEAADLIASDPAWAAIAGIVLRSIDQGRRIVSGLIENDGRASSLIVAVENASQFAEDFVTSAHGPKLEFVIDVGSDICVSMKSSLLERVFLNLFINAAQAARNAGRTAVKVDVQASIHDGAVRITIADDGPGLNANVLPFIFAPRFSSEDGRAGLGLHIVASIVNQHGGCVVAANRPGGGAVFTIDVVSENTAAYAAAAQTAEVH